MLSEIFSILAPILICVSIGYGWKKSGRSYDTQLVTDIVTYFGTPCLLFYALSTINLSSQQLLEMALAALLANCAFIVIGSIFLKLFCLPPRAFLQSLSFPNVGNIGLPLCFLAFGENGLALAMTFFAVYAVFQMTLGVMFVSGRLSISSFFTIPIIPATLLAVVFSLLSIPVPNWLFNTTKLIGDLTIPLMLFTLGVSLAQLHVKTFKTPALLAVSRLSMGFCVGVSLTRILGLHGPAAGVVILECSMPAAVFCYLLAQQYNQRPAEVAGIVVISTFLGLVSIPPLLWFVL